MNEHERADLRVLLDALCEESISAEQMRRLEELVLSNPEAEAYYVQYMSLYADLSRAKFGETIANASGSSPAKPHGRRIVRWGVIALPGLAAAVLLVAVLWPRREVEWHPVKQENKQETKERVDDSVAVLLQAHEAVWEKGDLPTRVGSPLRPGTLRLKSGAAHLEFYSGATVILQGPAELKLISRTKAYCVHGKLRATVPATAHGFTIGSAKLDLVDLGTEFGMQIDPHGKTEVHVFNGKVEVHDSAAPKMAPKELTTGQGVRMENAGQLVIRSDPAAFVTPQELAAQAQKEMQRRQKAWLAAGEELRRDDSLVLWYSFAAADNAWERMLRNQAGQRQEPHDGAIVGCAWTSGRWPGTQALDFKQVSDRVRIRVPGDFDSLTLMTWVRIDALPNVNNSLMMSDAWRPGGLHWQIGSEGKLILGVQSQPQGKGAHYHALDAITPDHFGRWLHVAVVYDHKQKLVTHYLNGEPLAQLPVLFDIPLRVGDAELGNWNIATHRNNSPIRFLTGSMDEFMIFSRALPDAEVEKLYEQGRPGA